MFDYTEYIELKNFVRKLYWSGLWNSLPQNIKRIYWADLKRLQRNTPPQDDRPLSLEYAEEFGVILADSFSVEEFVVQEKINEELHAAIDTLLDEQEQIIITLYFFEEKTETEVGIELGFSQKTINNKKRKIIGKLKEYLKDYR